MRRILILGAGFGGLETATGLDAHLSEGYEITLVDKSDSFYIGFSKIDVLFGRATEEAVCYPYAALRPENVRFVQDTVTAIDTDRRVVTTSNHTFEYDVLVVALGADCVHAATPGFEESGGYDFYTMAGARRLAPVIAEFSAGTLALGVLKMPYKCPPAPYEVACQFHEAFVARGVRDAITIKMVIPGPHPVKNPKVSELLESQLRERGIELVANAAISAIDADAQKVMTAAGELDYDLFVGVPVHAPPSVVKASGLGEGGFIRVSDVNLETTIPGVYAIGDVTAIPVGQAAVPKAGAFAENAAKTVVSDILRKEGLDTEFVKFEARGACYFELGADSIAKIDANYLGAEKPSVLVEGPSREFHVDKAQFASSRRERWFRL